MLDAGQLKGKTVAGDAAARRDRLHPHDQIAPTVPRWNAGPTASMEAGDLQKAVDAACSKVGGARSGSFVKLGEIGYCNYNRLEILQNHKC